MKNTVVAVCIYLLFIYQILLCKNLSFNQVKDFSPYHILGRTMPNEWFEMAAHHSDSKSFWLCEHISLFIYIFWGAIPHLCGHALRRPNILGRNSSVLSNVPPTHHILSPMTFNKNLCSQKPSNPQMVCTAHQEIITESLQKRAKVPIITTEEWGQTECVAGVKPNVAQQ